MLLHCVYLTIEAKDLEFTKPLRMIERRVNGEMLVWMQKD
jgi:hypothetical protein